MQTRQDLRARRPVFVCAAPRLATAPTLFQTLKAHAFYVPQLITALMLGALLHSLLGH